MIKFLGIGLIACVTIFFISILFEIIDSCTGRKLGIYIIPIISVLVKIFIIIMILGIVASALLGLL